MTRQMPQEVRDIEAAHRAGKISSQERDRRLTAVAQADTERAGLRSAAGIETRMVNSKPKLGKG